MPAEMGCNVRTIEVKLYKFEELGEKAKARALEDWKGKQTEIFWADETIDSLKALIKSAELKLKDWGIGAYSHSYVRLESFEGEDLTGKRALAWLENNLLAGLRIPYRGAKRWELARYGSYYRAGMIKPCPFTGYCADDDFLDELRKDIKEGSTVKEAFEALADKARRMLENELDAQQSEEYFKEHADANDYEFTEDGKHV
jgi:hypothetical protein